MKQSEALEMLRAMMFLVQKARSNAADPIFGIVDDPKDNVGLPITKDLLAKITPWLFDDSKCPLPALVKILDRAEQSGVLAPNDFFNMMTILYYFIPELVAVAPLVVGDILPAEQPDYVAYLSGWERE